LAVLVLAAPARGADICKALVVHEVGALENPASMLAAGTYDTAITQYNVDKATGVALFARTEDIVTR
jgi:hypothetical protein